MDGKTYKLRASCNACNESKVRCSQTKPTCARCERNKTTCVYGLSRRTHKDAPPISLSHSHSHSHSGSQPHSHSGSRRSSVHIPNATATANATTTANYTSTTTPFMPLHENSMTSYPPQPSVDQFFAQQQPHHQQPSTAGPGPGILSPANLDLPSFMTPLPTPNEDHTNSLFSSFGNFAAGVGGVNGSVNNILTPLTGSPGTGTSASTSTDMFQQPQVQECTCHAGVMEQMASMSQPSRNEERRLSLDVQLSQLKRCIIASEASMGCGHHGNGDSEPINIISVAMLIGRIIDEFELMLNERIGRGTTMPERERSLSLDEATISIREPRLCWGVLELEDDDEVELRQRLYLLYFRKLERLLSQLNVFVRTLHDSRGGSCNPTFIMACEYIHLWLEKKAEGVKRLFPAADEYTGRIPS
ncbi:Zn(II)2Cys6 transcription factor domain-containing protein [Aspergillus ruber CBS 135680]|uniref:Transcriptional regulator fogI n=1 Tax=Aspergillus ruber (strain CBS 135680) TaxID=1388766 RepID=FOGI_ASPRC|nr:uncharacterized protein EURHEDRAFT_402538 [Aspergillus ruber CBS 135680]A0A017SE85.1 RecName: Full=Transcriptional regulator fogI; AltName: Full=Flavoglaucin biosynthesis cluster protein I [Aspergillus ruber CBS 135680]EYE95343.1 hypothetical protein EURHEDRAFT_402538 [Aspergillus ruber CBS 135680]